MIKGPKAILSSAIAGALGEYFVLDADAIESNLLRDATIVLRRVRLKELVTCLPSNSAERSTKVTLTGCVKEVVFTWAWSVGQQIWVNDAVLTIIGARFQAKLEHEEKNVEGFRAAFANGRNSRPNSGSFVNPSTIDAASARQIKKEKGGLEGFVLRQLKMVIDTLTLKMIDPELRIILPPLLADLDTSSKATRQKWLILGADKMECISFGRCNLGNGSVDATSKLKQRINLSSFTCGVHIQDKGCNLNSFPLVEPFNYSADIARFGERFGGFLTGLEVLGIVQPNSLCPDLASMRLSVHLGTNQVDALMQIAAMVRNSNSMSKTGSPEGLSDKLSIPSNTTTSENEEDVPILAGDPSSFCFPLPSIKLVLGEENYFFLSGILVEGRGGLPGKWAVCRIEAESLECESVARYHGRAKASQVVIKLRPEFKMSIGTVCMEYEGDIEGKVTASDLVITSEPEKKITIGCIETLCIRDSVVLTDPINSCLIKYEQKALIVMLDTVNVMTFGKKEPSTPGVVISPPKLPCNIVFCAEKGMQIIKHEDGSVIKIGSLHIHASTEESCTKVALQCENMRNNLVSLTAVSLSGSLPPNEVNTIDEFLFNASEITVKSGHSSDEWIEAFQPRREKCRKRDKIKKCTEKVKKTAKNARKSATKIKAALIKLPFATIADLKVTIVLGPNRSKHSSLTITIRGYNGEAETTSKDLIRYYAAACLARARNFISNAAALGLESKLLKPGGAVAASVTAVDSIKGVVGAGKRSFHARIHTAVGSDSNSAGSLPENKKNIDTAGKGGDRSNLGVSLGGPVGTIVGSMIAAARAGAAFEVLDERGQYLKQRHQGFGQNV